MLAAVGRFAPALGVGAGELAAHPQLAIVGGFNVAPAAADTHDPAVWEDQILCSAPERAGLQALLDLGLTDAFAKFPAPEQRFTWWDYRQGAFRRNHGLRIDHVLVTAPLLDRVSAASVGRDWRKKKGDLKASDHAPVWAEFRQGT